MVKLDLYDKKILFELDIDARVSASNIAKKIKIPKETVNYRINRLINNGFIETFYTIINASTLGYSYTKIMLRIDKMVSEKEKEITDFLLNEKNCANIRVLQGYYEISFLFMHKNNIEFKNFMRSLVSKFGESISEKSIHAITESHKLNQKILFHGEKYRKYFRHVVQQDKNVNELDVKIITALLQNARIPMSKLAQELDEDPVKLTYRRKRLEEKGVIVGYATKLNFLKFAFEKVQLDISLINLDSTKDIIEFFDSKNMCFVAYEMIGDYDLSIEMAIKDDESLRKTMDEFKKKYYKVFKNYEISHIYRECASSWSPFSSGVKC